MSTFQEDRKKLRNIYMFICKSVCSKSKFILSTHNSLFSLADFSLFLLNYQKFLFLPISRRCDFGSNIHPRSISSSHLLYSFLIRDYFLKYSIRRFFYQNSQAQKSLKSKIRIIPRLESQIQIHCFVYMKIFLSIGSHLA